MSSGHQGAPGLGVDPKRQVDQHGCQNLKGYPLRWYHQQRQQDDDRVEGHLRFTSTNATPAVPAVRSPAWLNISQTSGTNRAPVKIPFASSKRGCCPGGLRVCMGRFRVEHEACQLVANGVSQGAREHGCNVAGQIPAAHVGIPKTLCSPQRRRS